MSTTYHQSELLIKERLHEPHRFVNDRSKEEYFPQSGQWFLSAVTLGDLAVSTNDHKLDKP